MFELPQWLYRMDNYLLATGMYMDKALELSERLCEIHLQNLEKWMSAVGPYVDIVLFGDDLGGQQGPLISPDAYRTLYKPYHKKLWGRAKELADIIIQATAEVEHVVLELRHRAKLKEILERCVEINRLENMADVVFRAAMAELFEDTTDIARVIKWREIYEHMESATDRCEDVANVIEGVALKNA